MSWITLTPDDLNGALGANEVAKFTQVSGNGDIRASLIDQVTREVRGYAGSAGPLGPDGTIPDELKDAAVSLVVWRYVTQGPAKSLATDARKNAADNALTLLRDVAKGAFRVVAPPAAQLAPEQTARPGIPTVEPGERGISRRALRRL